MEGRKIFAVGVIGVALAFFSMPAFAEEAWETTAQAMYEHGWYLQTSAKDFSGAMDVYQKLTERFAEDKAYCALSRVRIGQCLEAQGKRDEAVAAWQKALVDFPEQAEAVRDARLLLAGFDPDKAGNVEELEKQIDGLLENLRATAADRQAPLVLAAAYPAEGAEFLHAKLVELGKKYGPALARGEAEAFRNMSTSPIISSYLQALASCDTDKTVGYLMDLLSRAGDKEGQFFGADTPLAITTSFIYLKPQRASDEMVDLVIKQASESERTPLSPGYYRLPSDRSGFGINTPGPAYGFYTLAFLAGFNAKAEDYLKAEAVNTGAEGRAAMAMAALTRLEEAETAEFFEKIATGKFPETFRRTAITCLGWLGKTRYIYTGSNPDFPQLEEAELLRFIAYGLDRRGGSPWAMTYATASSKAAQPEKAVVDACMKALKAAFDFNNCAGMRCTVITSLKILAGDASMPALIEYAKSPIDPEVREAAALALGDMVEFGEKNAEVSAALEGIMKDDPAAVVRVQAAWSLARMGNPGDRGYNGRSVPLETVPVILEALANYKGTPPTTAGNLGMNITVTSAINSLFLTTFHGELFPTGPSGAQYDATTGKAIDEFAKWWAANKDKGEGEWAKMGMDEWVAKSKASLASEVPAAATYPPTAAIEPVINKLIDAYTGKPETPTRPFAYERYSREQVKMICDWWEANRDKVKWDSKARCFVLPE
jgi:tetratricopeptide (TPR) repeat protein